MDTALLLARLILAAVFTVSGVAKLVDDRPGEAGAEPHATLTVAGMIVGTPAYMAPEQLRADPPDARTDVFALGVIAYEMLCGELPFSRGALTDVILAQARGPQPLAARDPSLPAPLDYAVQRALSMNPDDRPATPQAFAVTVLQAIAVAT